MGDYERWRRERDLEQAAIRGLGTPTPAKPTIESDVIVPTLQALAIGTAGGLAAGTLTILIGFGATGWARWALAGKVGVGTFVFVLATATVTFILQHRRAVFEPLDLLWERLSLALGGGRAAPEDEPSYVVVRPQHPRLAATVEHQVKPITPEVDNATERLYKFVISTWPGGPSISRRRCAGLGFSRKTWEKYVGGVRGKEGQETGRGLLDRAGVVTKTANGWEIAAPLGDALSITDKLKTYAEAKAALVVGRDGLGPGRDKTGAGRDLSHHRGAGGE